MGLEDGELDKTHSLASAISTKCSAAEPVRTGKGLTAMAVVVC